MKNPEYLTLKSVLLSVIILVAGSMLAAGENDEPPPDSTEPTGQSFAEPRPEETLRVLLAGAGDHHHFPRYFLGTDSDTLRSAGGIDTAATPNLDEALELLPDADVLVFSGNHPMYGGDRFQQALRDHAAAGKGIVLVHAALWNHDWEGYGERFVGGGSGGHGFGEVEVIVENDGHPVMEGVPATFTVTDESYHHEFRDDADADVLAENAPDDRTGRPHASVWAVNDPETRIVCITLGHDGRAHDHSAYQSILTNAVRWVAEESGP